MEDRTRNILLGFIVLFGVLGAGVVFMQPYLTPAPEGGGGPARPAPGAAGPGAAEYAQARRLMEEGRFTEAQGAYVRLIQQHAGQPVATKAQADKDHGIPYHQGVRFAQAGNIPQAQALLNRVAREGARTEWGPKASAELSRLAEAGPPPVTGVPAPGPPLPGAPGAPVAAGSPEQGRQARLAQANRLLEAGRIEEARAIYQALASEGVEDAAGAAARLQLSTLQVARQAGSASPDVSRARVALHRTRASLLAYRGETGRFPPTLQTPDLERFGFTYRDLLADVLRVESYRAEAGGQFELIVVAQDARGTRVRATDRSVEDLP